jgi:hypothetical protein
VELPGEENMKQVILLVCVLVTLALSNPAALSAQEMSVMGAVAPQMAEGAPPELMHWGKMVGRWSTREESLNADTSMWEPSMGGDWDFHWAFNGWGIQDNYSSPPLNVELDDESGRQRGINLRIYNPVTEKWVLTWLTTASTRALTMTAESTNDQIVMLADDANPQGYYSRITFFDMAETSFEWKLEWSSDRIVWVEVYRIHGSRKTATESVAVPVPETVAEDVISVPESANDAAVTPQDASELIVPDEGSSEPVTPSEEASEVITPDAGSSELNTPPEDASELVTPVEDTTS